MDAAPEPKKSRSGDETADVHTSASLGAPISVPAVMKTVASDHSPACLTSQPSSVAEEVDANQRQVVEAVSD